MRGAAPHSLPNAVCVDSEQRAAGGGFGGDLPLNQVWDVGAAADGLEGTLGSRLSLLFSLYVPLSSSGQLVMGAVINDAILNRLPAAGGGGLGDALFVAPFIRWAWDAVTGELLVGSLRADGRTVLFSHLSPVPEGGWKSLGLFPFWRGRWWGQKGVKEFPQIRWDPPCGEPSAIPPSLAGSRLRLASPPSQEPPEGLAAAARHHPPPPKLPLCRVSAAAVAVVAASPALPAPPHRVCTPPSSPPPPVSSPPAHPAMATTVVGDGPPVLVAAAADGTTDGGGSSSSADGAGGGAAKAAGAADAASTSPAVQGGLLGRVTRLSTRNRWTAGTRNSLTGLPGARRPWRVPPFSLP